MKKLIATDPPYVLPEYLEQIKNLQLKYIQYDTFDRSAEALRERGREANIILLDPSTDYPREILEEYENLEAIITTSVGTDHIDTDYCSENDIKVINFPGFNANGVAEHAFGLMLALVSNLCKVRQGVKSGKWRELQFDSIELMGKGLGLVGAGNIGENLIRIAKGFGMKVLAYTKNPSEQRAQKLGIDKFYSFDEVISESDFIVSSIPANEETNGLFNLEVFSKMKDSAYFINVGRGDVVNSFDLYTALKNSSIKAAAVDVFSQEPLDVNESEDWVKELVNMKNFLITPHIAGSTHEANHRMGQRMVEEIKGLI